MTMTKHYHVLTGMGGGYLPNGNDICSTKQSAQDTAMDHANEWRDQIATDNTVETDPVERYQITGNKRDGYWITRPNNPHCLGYYVEIVECHDDDCHDEED